MTQENSNQWLEIAIHAAQEAGKILKQGTNLRQVNMQNSKDVKLQADLESEKLIRQLLSEKTDFPIVGEEEGGDESLPTSDQLYWVVDPLDGTYNYLRDIPLTCVSIGLMCGLEAKLGVIYDFNNDELYTGIVGQGYWFNGKSVQPQWAEKIEYAVLNTGFPAARDYSTEALQEFISNIQRFNKVRMIGSAALAITFVASGRCDAYCEESIRLWDVAAGLALLKASGGSYQITPSSSDQPFAYNIWAAGKKEWLPAD